LTLAAGRGPVSGPINSRYTGWRYQFDLKATKTVRVSNLDVELSLWVINLFNTTNALTVYRSSGLPDVTGWLETPDGRLLVDTYNEAHDSSGLTAEEKYRLREQDPVNYDAPRQVRVGVKFAF
jgi:hypothetical protein